MADDDTQGTAALIELTHTLDAFSSGPEIHFLRSTHRLCSLHVHSGVGVHMLVCLNSTASHTDCLLAKAL